MKYSASSSSGELAIAASLVMGFLAILCGAIGFSLKQFDPANVWESVWGVFLNTLASFNISSDLATYKDGNAFTKASNVLGATTLFTGGIAVALVALRSQLLKLRIRYFWAGHVVLIGDTPLLRSVATWLSSEGETVLHAVPVDAGPQSLPYRIPVTFDVSTVMAATSLDRARLVVVDLDSDAATLAFGQSLCAAPAATRGGWLRPLPKGPAAIALRIADQMLSDQFFEFVELRRQSGSAEAEQAPATISSDATHLTTFDEHRVIARYILAQYPLFAMADARGQQQVHAVILGSGDLAERLLDQVMLTSLAGSLGAPRVTILDDQADRRRREFDARRPKVLDGLQIEFVNFDINIDLSAETKATEPLRRLLDLEKAVGITAIYVALPGDSDSLRAALLLRRYQDRHSGLNAPVFYYWSLSSVDATLLQGSPGARGANIMVAMQAPPDAVVREVSDPDGRDALARALHENYLRSTPDAAASKRWEQLPEALRRANVRAADHIPAMLWSAGLDIVKLPPGKIPRLEPDEARLLTADGPENMRRTESIARLEHERWVIERKLDGWSYADVRDDQKRLHPLLITWEQLEKSPHEVRKDEEQVARTFQFLSSRAADQPGEAGNS